MGKFRAKPSVIKKLFTIFFPGYGNLYQASRAVVNNCILMAKEDASKRNVNSIVAIEKNDYVEMHKDVFSTTEELDVAIKGYEKEGFKVHFTRKEDRDG